MKIARSIGILYRLRNVYPESVQVTIYNTLILPHFHYCLLLGGSVVKENISLHPLQRKPLRIITNSDYLTHTENPYIRGLRYNNKLSLNVKKTKYMVFHTAQRKVTYPILTLNFIYHGFHMNLLNTC